MRPFRSGVAAAALLLMGAQAYAQTMIVRPGWSPDEDRVVREYVPPDVALYEYHFDQTLRPGSIVPPGVPLKLFPANAPDNLRGYAYFVSVDHKVVVVEADTRRVARILGGG